MNAAGLRPAYGYEFSEFAHGQLKEMEFDEDGYLREPFYSFVALGSKYDRWHYPDMTPYRRADGSIYFNPTARLVAHCHPTDRNMVYWSKEFSFLGVKD